MSFTLEHRTAVKHINPNAALEKLKNFATALYKRLSAPSKSIVLVKDRSKGSLSKLSPPCKTPKILIANKTKNLALIFLVF